MEFLIVVFYITLICLAVKLNRKSKDKTSYKVSKEKPRIPYASVFIPFKVPILNSIYHILKFKRDGVRMLEEIGEKFGYLFEIDIGPTSVVATADPDVVQKVLSSMEPTHLNKTKAIYDIVFLECFKDGLLNADYEIWSPQRKLLNRCFNYKSLQHYAKIMNRHCGQLAKSLMSFSTPAYLAAETQLPANNAEIIFDKIYFYSMKIIAQILMETDRFADDQIEEFTKNFKITKCLITERLLNPLLLFKPYWYFHPMKKEFDWQINYLTTFLKQMITESKMSTQNYLKEKTEAEDIGIKPFRCVIEEMISCQATDKEIYDAIGTLLGAGHETTYVAVQMLIQQLALYPEHQSRCREEIRNVFESKGLMDPSEEDDIDITMEDLSNLKYLERCIMESSRLTSIVPAFMRTLGSPIKIDTDLELKSGTNLAIVPWLVHTSPKYYPNPKKFDPDRFLPENIKDRHPYAFIPFSGGARNCIGYKVAIMQIKMIMIWLLHKYEVRSEDKFEDVKLLFEVTLRPERDYRISLIPL